MKMKWRLKWPPLLRPPGTTPQLFEVNSEIHHGARWRRHRRWKNTPRRSSMNWQKSLPQSAIPRWLPHLAIITSCLIHGCISRYLAIVKDWFDEKGLARAKPHEGKHSKPLPKRWTDKANNQYGILRRPPKTRQLHRTSLHKQLAFIELRRRSSTPKAKIWFLTAPRQLEKPSNYYNELAKYNPPATPQNWRSPADYYLQGVKMACSFTSTYNHGWPFP